MFGYVHETMFGTVPRITVTSRLNLREGGLPNRHAPSTFVLFGFVFPVQAVALQY